MADSDATVAQVAADAKAEMSRRWPSAEAHAPAAHRMLLLLKAAGARFETFGERDTSEAVVTRGAAMSFSDADTTRRMFAAVAVGAADWGPLGHYAALGYHVPPAVAVDVCRTATVWHYTTNGEIYLHAAPFIYVLVVDRHGLGADECYLKLYGPPDALVDAPVVQHILALKAQAHVAAPPGLSMLRQRHGQLEWIELPVTAPKLRNLDLYYGDGFAQVDRSIVKALRGQRKGVVLIHGPPGGGKTTYIRHLCSRLAGHKRVGLIPRALLGAVGEPAFMDLLLEMSKVPTVLVVEDAEDVVTPDSRGRGPAASTLLNLTDGLLNDVAHVQVVLTFNVPIDRIDAALLRNGRLLVRHAMNPLREADARRLAAAKGLDPDAINGPTMLADVIAEKAQGNEPARRISM